MVSYQVVEKELGQHRSHCSPLFILTLYSLSYADYISIRLEAKYALGKELDDMNSFGSGHKLPCHFDQVLPVP